MYRIFVINHTYNDRTEDYDEDARLFYSPELASEYQLTSAVMNSEANKVDTLTMVIPPGHPLYDFPKLVLSEVVLFRGSECIFAGRPMSVQRDFHNMKTVMCESFFGLLNDVIMHGTCISDQAYAQGGSIYTVPSTEKFAIIGGANAYIDDIFNKWMNRVDSSTYLPTNVLYRFNRDTIEFTMPSKANDGNGYGSAKTAMEYLLDLPDLCKAQGCYVYRYSGYDYLLQSGGSSGTTTLPNNEVVRVRDIYVSWYGTTEGGQSLPTATQEIRFGVNLVDLKETIDTKGLYTLIHASTHHTIINADDEITVDENVIQTLLGMTTESEVNSFRGDYCQSPENEGIKQYGYFPLNKSFDDGAENRYMLIGLINGDADSQMNFAFNYQIDVNAIDMSLIDEYATAMKPGLYGRIVSQPHNIDKVLLCTSMSLDLLDPTNSRYTYGALKSSITAQNVSDMAWTKRRFDRLG